MAVTARKPNTCTPLHLRPEIVTHMMRQSINCSPSPRANTTRRLAPLLSQRPRASALYAGLWGERLQSLYFLHTFTITFHSQGSLLLQWGQSRDVKVTVIQQYCDNNSVSILLWVWHPEHLQCLFVWTDRPGSGWTDITTLRQ